jgi:hypothetical protein
MESSGALLLSWPLATASPTCENPTARTFLQLLAVQTQLQDARDGAAEREKELRGQVEQLQAGIGRLSCPQTQDTADSLRREIEAASQRQQAAVSALEAQLAACAQRHEAALADAKLVSDQAALIRGLEAQLADRQAAAAAAAEQPVNRAAAGRERRRVRELDARVAELREQVAERDAAESAAAAAADPADENSRTPGSPGPALPSLDGLLIEQLQAKADGLQAQIKSEAAAHERAAADLRRRCDELRAQAAWARQQAAAAVGGVRALRCSGVLLPLQSVLQRAAAATVSSRQPSPHDRNPPSIHARPSRTAGARVPRSRPWRMR